MKKLLCTILLCLAPSVAMSTVIGPGISGATFSAYTSVGRVPDTRTVNGQALSSDVTISTITGNAGTATALQTAKTINGVSFNGSANIGQDLQTTAVPAFAGLAITTGANAKMGSGTLVAGAATISNTSVTANSYIFLTDTGGGVLANMGFIYEDKPSRIANTSFVVKSLNVLDSSAFIYLIIEP